MKNQFHPKYQQKYFWISALKFFVAFWGLPVGFHIYDTVRKIVLKLLLYLYFRTKVLKFRHDILIK